MAKPLPLNHYALPEKFNFFFLSDKFIETEYSQYDGPLCRLEPMNLFQLLKIELTEDRETAVEDPNTMWTFCPSVQPAYVMAILFGITTLAHLIQAILHKKTYCWVITMSGLWQTVNYVLRILSIKNPTNYPYYAGWFILILVSIQIGCDDDKQANGVTNSDHQ